VVSRFVYATQVNVPDYIEKGGETYRLILDHLGSVRLVVDISNDSVVQRLDYDEFGVVTTNTNPGFQPFGYAGGLYDEETGLVRFGARDYDAETGRWTVKDPLGFGGESSNVYAYLLGDPINFFDPAGASVWSAARRFVIGLASGFVGAVATGVGLTVLGAASPILAAGGMVALAGYGGWQVGMAGQRILGGYDPWTRCGLTNEERIDEAAGFLGTIIGSAALSGPRGPLFGRARYRNGVPGLFNRGNTRVGWSWDNSVGRNMWGGHGGAPGTPTHWHYTPVPGPVGPAW
jgi:RHS repeat-associated protein